MTSDPNSPEVLISVPTDVAAIAIINALADEGIEATMTGTYTAGFQAEAPGMVDVVVRQQDLEKARAVLAKVQP